VGRLRVTAAGGATSTSRGRVRQAQAISSRPLPKVQVRPGSKWMTGSAPLRFCSGRCRSVSEPTVRWPMPYTPRSLTLASMHFFPARAIRPRRPLRARSRGAVVAFVLLGLVQLFVSAVVPFAEARAPSRLGAHIERPTERHYVHDEAYCSACTARHLTGTAPVAEPPVAVAPLSAKRVSLAVRVAPDAERRDPLAARAPPAPRPLG